MCFVHASPPLQSSSTVQGFLSLGAGNRRRGHGGAQQAKKIKLLMLGDSGVGKSSLMDRFTEDYFNLNTVGEVKSKPDLCGISYVAGHMTTYRLYVALVAPRIEATVSHGMATAKA